MANPALAAKWCSKWQLVVDVRREDGSPPYQATLVISLPLQRKPHEWVPKCHCDTIRPTVKHLPSISIAMGYGDPYEAVLKMFRPEQGN